MTRVALYARYSSDQQSVASIEDQFRVCRERAEREGWHVVGTYEDAAITGSTLILRPGVRALLQDAEAGRFDLVLLVDSMPYVVQAGLADEIVAGVVAGLQAGGALAILNLSYGRDPAEDLADMDRWAIEHDLDATASQPFQLWDGRAFLLRSRKPAR